jgi:electron transfer flavoprotein alpha/beta subunit
MKTIVLIKQVPVVSAMKLDPETKTLKREGVPSEVSSFDIRALLKAIELRTSLGGEVVALTMGPPQAKVEWDLGGAGFRGQVLYFASPLFWPGEKCYYKI